MNIAFFGRFDTSMIDGVNLNVVNHFNSPFHLNGSLGDNLTYSVYLTILHRNMRLFRRKLYQMPFAERFERSTVEKLFYDFYKRRLLIHGYMCLFT